MTTDLPSPQAHETAEGSPGPVDVRADGASEGPSTGEPSAKVGARYIWLQVLAQFGVFLAFITPMAISMSIRLEQLAPGREEVLGYITGASSFVSILTGVLFGVWSDRTRTRIGRRRPFMIGGSLVGMIALFVMAIAPNVLVLGAGWVLVGLGWGTVLANVQATMADRLPAEQRGKVAGLAGFATQIAPVFGVAIAGMFAAQSLLLFLLPGTIGAVLVLLFVVFIHEDDNRGEPREPLDLPGLLGKFVFDPRKHPDFSWNWLGRFLFYFGLTYNTTFTAFFFSSRLGMTVAEFAPLMTMLSLVGIVATTAGALGGGFLSDRFRRRRVFVLASGVVFGAGALTMAFSSTLPLLMAGSLMGSLGIGLFSTVDQALLLDVLPERETNAARFMAINNFANSIPQAIAPVTAPAILAIGVSAAGEQNYTLLYIIAALSTIAGGLIVLRVRSVR